MLAHFVIVLRHLRTPPEKPSAFRRLCLLSSAGVLRRCRYAASAARDSPCKTKKRKPYACDFGGGDKGSRTPDLLNAIQALYQLSYAPKWWAIRDSNP